MLTNGQSTETRGPIGTFIDLVRQTRMLVRIALLAAIVLGIIAGVSLSICKMSPGSNGADDIFCIDKARQTKRE